MGNFESFFKELKFLRSRPEIKNLWLFLGIIGVLLIGNWFFLSAYLIWVNLIVFLVVAIYATMINLKTARYNLETMIKSRELGTVIENLDAAVISYDPNFKIITFNKAAEAIFNIASQEIVGQKINPNFVKNPHFRQLTQTMFPSLAPVVNQISESNSWPQIVDISLEEPTKELKTILNRITDENGGTIGFFKIIRDLTREKAILKSKSEFIGIAAHQLRTPLNAVNWALESLNNANKDKALAETISTGHDVAQRALKIVNDLLDVSKIEEGHFGYNFEDTNLKDFLETVLSQFKPVADQYKISLYLKPISENIKVRIDPQRLSIALSNLIDNAIRYNVKNGKVEVSAEKSAAEPFVKISVEDTGVGIPTDELNKLFGKFYRGTNIIQIEPNGNGLGLYITKNIIQQHGGKIGAESIQDRGSTFYFTLPLDFSKIPTKEIFRE